MTHTTSRPSRVFIMLAASACTFWVLSQVITVEVLPDFSAYERIYESEAENFAASPTERYFAAAVRWATAAGLSYMDFRHAVLVASVGLFLLAAYLVDNWASRNRARDLPELNIAFMTLVLAPAAIVFFFEFFLIRIRAGIAIALVSMAFALYFTGRRGGLAGALLPGLLLMLSYGMHGFTTAVLGYLLFAPFIYHPLYRRVKLTGVGRADVTAITALITLVSVWIVLTVAGLSEARGEHMSSPLNTVRLMAVAALPLGLEGLRALVHQGRPSHADEATHGRGESWVIFATVCYGALACGLLISVPLGATTEAGEAIVRIFTLSSVPAILTLILREGRHEIMWLFLFASNSAFFVNTLLTPWRS